MTIKKCTCGHKISTKATSILAITKMGGKRVMWLNCPECHSTLTLMAPIKKAVAVALAMIAVSCAPKAPSRFTICQAVQVSCSSGQCSGQALKDVNTGQFVNASQCDEVR